MSTERQDEIDLQWERVNAWRSGARNEAEKDDLSASVFREQFSNLYSQWISLVSRRPDVSKDYVYHESITPFIALIRFIEQGCYPPPELLIHLAETFQQFIDEGGSTRENPRKLETMLVGKPIKGKGAYAAALQKDYESERAATEILAIQAAKKCTAIDATEEHVLKNGLAVDADSLLRTIQKTESWQFRDGKSEK